MRKVAGNGLGTTLGPLTGPWFWEVILMILMVGPLTGSEK